MEIRTIEDCKMLQKVFHNGRWYVDLMPSLNGRDRIPFSHYKWLETNPSFVDIPRGYIIHHLDFDETNDDPTNLVLMSKPIHTAYHWKHKTQKVPIKFAYNGTRTENIYTPTQKPIIIYDKKQNRHYLHFYEKVNGRNKRKRVFSYGDLSGFKSKEDAEIVRDEIWKRNCEND